MKNIIRFIQCVLLTLLVGSGTAGAATISFAGEKDCTIDPSLSQVAIQQVLINNPQGALIRGVKSDGTAYPLPKWSDTKTIISNQLRFRNGKSLQTVAGPCANNILTKDLGGIANRPLGYSVVLVFMEIPGGCGCNLYFIPPNQRR